MDLEDYGFLQQSHDSSQLNYTFEVTPIQEIIRVREVKDKLLSGELIYTCNWGSLGSYLFAHKSF
jgi:hypothetical protein